MIPRSIDKIRFYVEVTGASDYATHFTAPLAIDGVPQSMRYAGTDHPPSLAFPS